MTGESKGTVLVADDNRIIADTYAEFLADEYDVRTAYGGPDAVDALDSTVDVVLLDRRMPDLSGDEVLSRIEDLALDCRTVMVTAVDVGPEIADLPFDEYVVKPVGREELVAVVEEMFRRATYDDELRQYLALASKKATLEAETDAAELADSEALDRIDRRLAERREELGYETDALERVVSGDRPDIAGTDERNPAESDRSSPS